MALKNEFASLDDIPESWREHAIEQNGKFALDLEGMVTADRLSEFRKTNTTLMKKTQELTGELEKLKEAVAAAEKEKAEALEKVKEEGGDGKATELERQVAQLTTRLERVQKQYDEQLAAERTQKAEKEQELHAYILKSELTRAIGESGVLPEAVEDALARGLKVFRYQEGKVLAMDGDGPLEDDKGNAITPKLYYSSVLPKLAKHHYPSSTGGNASGNNGARSGARVVDRNDPVAFGNNLEDIASGKITVQ